MMTLGFGRIAVSASVAAALLAACGVSQPPIGASGAMAQGLRQTPAQKTKALLYVSRYYTETVSVFTYPHGPLVRTLDLSSEPLRLCVDNRGDVFVPEGYVVEEYPHGGKKQIRTFSLTSYSGDPFFDSCAFDSRTDRLAVGGGSGVIAVFSLKDFSGPPALYYANYDELGFSDVTYDGNDDLFATGDYEGSNFILVELSRGSASLQRVNVPADAGGDGGLQWDGTYLAMPGRFDSAGLVIDRIRIRNNKATVMGRLILEGNEVYAHQFWINGNTIISPINDFEDVAFWRYPAGGKSWNTITGAGPNIDGVALSIAPKQERHKNPSPATLARPHLSQWHRLEMSRSHRSNGDPPALRLKAS
jgi:hypothetical protein